MAKPFFKSLFKKKSKAWPRKSSHGSQGTIFLREILKDRDETKGQGFTSLHYKGKMCAATSGWCLVEGSGERLTLPQTMLFLGREDCDINISSRSVDKRHAVLTYDEYEDKFRIKDLSSVNGTYVDDKKIAEQEYVTLEDMDTIRFGYDQSVYRMERIEEQPHLEVMDPSSNNANTLNPIQIKVTSTKVTPNKVSPRSSPPLIPIFQELPQWAVREPPKQTDASRIGLAECQGCIVEQGIRHTCGISEDPDNTPPQTPLDGSNNANGHGTSSSPAPKHPHSDHHHHHHHPTTDNTTPPATPVSFNRWAESRRSLNSSQHTHTHTTHSIQGLHQLQQQQLQQQQHQHGHPHQQIYQLKTEVQEEQQQSRVQRQSSSSPTDHTNSSLTTSSSCIASGQHLYSRTTELVTAKEQHEHQQHLITNQQKSSSSSNAHYTTAQVVSSASSSESGQYQYHFQEQNQQHQQTRQYHNKSQQQFQAGVSGPFSVSGSSIETSSGSGGSSKVGSHGALPISQEINFIPSKEEANYPQSKDNHHSQTIPPQHHHNQQQQQQLQQQHLQPQTKNNNNKATENYQTHFQIIPPRQGQNYRVINVQFAGANLPGIGSGIPGAVPQTIKPDVLSPSSLGYQNLNAPVGQFVFLTPHHVDNGQIIDGAVNYPVQEIDHSNVTTVESNGSVASEYSNVIFSNDPNLCEQNRQAPPLLLSNLNEQLQLQQQQQQHQQQQQQQRQQQSYNQRPVGLSGFASMGANDEGIIINSSNSVQHTSSSSSSSSKVLVKQQKSGGSSSSQDNSPVHRGIYSPPTPGSPHSIRQDQRRSLTGTEPDLETINKCTPLYGQPSWWGEDDAEENYPHTATFADAENNKENEKKHDAERPNTLAVGDQNADMDKYKTDPQYATTYMEIPQHEPSSGSSTPTKQDTTPSSHQQKNGERTPPIGEEARRNADIHTPPEKDVGLGKEKAPAEPPMAFTVDLGDDIGGAPKLNMKHSLSEFLPQKVRKSFRSRSTKSRRNSEDKEELMRDGSPVSQLHTGSPSYHSDGGHHSTHSSDNEDISIRSDTVTTKIVMDRSKKISFDLMFTEADVPPPPPMFSYDFNSAKKSSTSPRIHTMSRGSRREKQQTFSQKTNVRKTSELRKQQTSLTSTTDSTNYLIERMFNQPTSGRARAPVSVTTDSVEDSSGFVTYDDVPSIEKPPSDGPSSSKQSRTSGPGTHADNTGGEPGQTETLRPFDRQGSLSDNISESGTYTIESESQGSDLQKARESIDVVFGLEETVQEADIRLDKAIKGHVTDFTTRPKRFTKTRQKLTHGDSLDVEVGSNVEPDDNEEDFKIVEVLFDGVWASPKLTRRTPEVHSYQPEAVVSSSDTPKWVNQWATLATQKTFVKTTTATTSSTTLEGYGEAVDVQSSSESLNGVQQDKLNPPRRRYGTGRKLPTPPVKSSSTTPLSPRSTTGQSSEFFSPRDSILSETPEKDLDEKQHLDDQDTMGQSNFIDPRPDRSILSDILPGGVTSDVVTFVHDDMSESVFTDMTESMTSSKMTESFVDENHQEDHEQEVEDLTTNISSEHQCPEPNIRRSIDTEILLRDTADVVQAMAERVKNSQEQQEEAKVPLWQQRKSTELFIPLHDDDTDSDGSARAFVNGHRDMPKLKPKPNLQRNRSKDTSSKASRPFLSREERELEQGPVKERSSVSRDIRSSSRSSPKPKAAAQPKTTTTKPSTTKSPHKVQPPKIPKDATFVKGDTNKTGRQHRLPSLDLNNSFCSDIQSESESIVSTSTEYSGTMSPRLDRRGSKGKGPMSLTRPNRAFALRRARLESEEQQAQQKPQSNTARSRPNSAGARDTLRSRPNSAGAVDHSRSRPLSARDSSSRRTDSGLNAKTVNRNRDRSTGPPRAKSAGPQTDYSRMTARHEKKPSLSSQPRRSPAPPSSSSRKSEKISVNNISLSGSRSKPTSRSNSPQIANQKRSEEYSAWKRRKSYDPRQAVVNAKVKAKDNRMKNTPERSLSAGPHSRAETFSSVSSEDTSYGIDDLQNYPDLDTDDPISQASSAVSHQMEAMSRSIESENSFSDTKLGFARRILSIGRSNRSAFSVPRTKSAPLTSLRSPPPPSQSRSRVNSINNGSTENGLVGVSDQKHAKLESYDSVMVNSIYQLSLKVKTQTDRIVEKMRDQSQLNGSPSPTDDLCSPTLEREIPGYKNASQELIGILRNLRSTERHLRDIDRVLFPGRNDGASPGSPKNHEHYLRELERIRNEISGFRPIDNPTPTATSTRTTTTTSTTKTKSPVTRNRSPWRRTRQPSHELHADPLASDEYF